MADVGGSTTFTRIFSRCSGDGTVKFCKLWQSQSWAAIFTLHCPRNKVFACFMKTVHHHHHLTVHFSTKGKQTEMLSKNPDGFPHFSLPSNISVLSSLHYTHSVVSALSSLSTYIHFSRKLGGKRSEFLWFTVTRYFIGNYLKIFGNGCSVLLATF